MSVVIVTLLEPSKFVVPLASPPRVIALVFNNCDAVLTFPTIVFVTERLVSVPTDVRLEFNTVDLRVVPSSVDASDVRRFHKGLTPFDCRKYPFFPA
jgi:hypothetical protein